MFFSINLVATTENCILSVFSAKKDDLGPKLNVKVNYYKWYKNET